MLNLPDALQMRPCTDADQAFLLGLYRTTRDDLLSIQADQAFLGQLIAMQFQIQAQAYRNMHPDAGYWLILRDGHAIGRLILAEYNEQIRLVDISLQPDERQSGHGTSLLKALQAWAAMTERPVCLSVAHNNPGAHKLYLAMGFVAEESDALQTHMRWQSIAALKAQ